jgi:FtsP/CotA-like multicopper oxidase with cupredoxin domain
MVIRNKKRSSARSRREFLKQAGLAAGVAVLPSGLGLIPIGSAKPIAISSVQDAAADYTLHIKVSPVEIAPKRIISTTTYNGQFPGPLVRFKEGPLVTVDVYNDTDTPEQLHWHGQKVPAEVDGASEEGTPFIPAHGTRRITFTPGPAGVRFYHSHNRAGANLAEGQHKGEVGAVYIEPRRTGEL